MGITRAKERRVGVDDWRRMGKTYLYVVDRSLAKWHLVGEVVRLGVSRVMSFLGNQRVAWGCCRLSRERVGALV
jgi:hypothetical protein